MAQTSYNGLRVPVIPLDYNSRFLAEKKEILFDYKTHRLYVVSAEDKTIIYDITNEVMKEVREGVDLTNFVLNVEGIGDVNLSQYIQELSKFNLQLITEENKQYYAPTIRYDNMSIVNRDGVVEVAGFKHALNNTYAVKDGNMIKWVQRTDTDVITRLRRLEELAPPDPEQFKALQEDVKNLHLTADLYRDLPALRRDVDTNTEAIRVVKTSIARINELDQHQSQITDLQEKNTALTNRILVLESVEDPLPKITNLDGRLKVLEGKEDLQPKVIDLQQKVANLMQAPDYGAQIATIEQKLIMIQDHSSSSGEEVTNKLAELQEADNAATLARKALSDRLDAFDNMEISTNLETLKSKVTNLEGRPELSDNVNNLEQVTNTLTNSVALLKTQVTGLINKEDLTPRVNGLESRWIYEANRPVQDEEQVVSDQPVEVTPNSIYQFQLNTDDPIFSIRQSSNKTQDLTLILNPANLNGAAFNVHIQRLTAEGEKILDLKMPLRIASTSNRESKIVYLKTYDGGTNWFYTVYSMMVGADALIDDNVDPISAGSGSGNYRSNTRARVYSTIENATAVSSNDSGSGKTPSN